MNYLSKIYGHYGMIIFLSTRHLVCLDGWPNQGEKHKTLSGEGTTQTPDSLRTHTQTHCWWSLTPHFHFTSICRQHRELTGDPVKDTLFTVPGGKRCGRKSSRIIDVHKPLTKPKNKRYEYEERSLEYWYPVRTDCACSTMRYTCSSFVCLPFCMRFPYVLEL